MNSILIIDEDKLSVEPLAAAAEKLDQTVAEIRVKDDDMTLAWIERSQPDVLVVSEESVYDWEEIAARVNANCPATTLFLTSENPTFSFLKKAIRYDIAEVLQKPLTSEKIEKILKAVTEVNPEKREISAYINGQTFIARAKAYLKENYFRDVTLKEMAASLNMSNWHLSRLIRVWFDKTFIEMLGEVRIERAAQLLLTTDQKIKEIAKAVGFEEYVGFLELFKNQTGDYPAGFRKKNIV